MARPPIQVRPRWTDDELQLTPNRTFRPTYTDEVTGDVALTDAAFNAIREGYGCSNCLRYFDGVYLRRCPECRHPTGDFLVIEPWWNGSHA